MVLMWFCGCGSVVWFCGVVLQCGCVSELLFKESSSLLEPDCFSSELLESLIRETEALRLRLQRTRTFVTSLLTACWNLEVSDSNLCTDEN